MKTLSAWTYRVLAIAGAILVGSMLLNWIDLGDELRATGLEIARADNRWMFLVPIAGAVLLVAAATRSAHTRLAALFAGVVVSGYVLFNVSRSMIQSGLDTWLILGGAGALLAGAAKERAIWRAVGGVAVLAGFFAPWQDLSMFGALRALDGDVAVMRTLWLVPVAGVAGLASAANLGGGKLAAASGIAIYGALLAVIGAIAWEVFGLGAWAALGASTVALAIGVLARGPAAAAASR